ncbi:MAG: MTH938/NDUFAF3 family protein [Mariprofundaceae bacterium]|nr:MTH938/NDUFAF3 family protein [Mariprofundaceae bacterium]
MRSWLKWTQGLKAMFGGVGTTFHLDVSPDVQTGTPLLRGYGDDYLEIAQTRYKQGLSLHQGIILSPWGPDEVRQLEVMHLQHILEKPPEVLIIGTGRRTIFPNGEVLEQLTDTHMGFECMDSRAAARTYNILIGEGRKTSVVFFLPNVRR